MEAHTVAGSLVTASLREAEEIMIVNNKTVQKAPAMNNIGNFYAVFSVFRYSIASMQGDARCFPVERNGFNGIPVLHIVARIIQHHANFFLARRYETRVSCRRETVNLHERTLILCGKGNDIEGENGGALGAERLENEKTQKNGYVPPAAP